MSKLDSDLAEAYLKGLPDLFTHYELEDLSKVNDAVRKVLLDLVHSSKSKKNLVKKIEEL